MSFAQRRVLQILGRTGTATVAELRRGMEGNWHSPATALVRQGYVERIGDKYALTRKATPLMPDIMG